MSRLCDNLVVLSSSGDLYTNLRRALRREALDWGRYHLVRSASDFIRKIGNFDSAIVVLDAATSLQHTYRVLAHLKETHNQGRFPCLLVAAEDCDASEALATEFRVVGYCGGTALSLLQDAVCDFKHKREHPSNEWRNFVQMEAYRQQGAWGSAAMIAHKQTKLMPGSLWEYELYFNYAQSGQLQDHHDTAARMLETRDPRLYQVAARNLWRAGKLREAVVLLERAQQLSPWHLGRQYLVGVLFLNLGRFDDGLRAFEKILRLAPASAEGLLGVAAAQLLMGHYPEGLGALRQVVSHRESATTLNACGVLARRLGLFIRAKDLFHAAAERLEGQGKLRARVYFNLGLTLVAQSRPREGVVFFEKAVRQDREHLAAHSNLLFLSEALTAPLPKTEDLRLLPQSAAERIAQLTAFQADEIIDFGLGSDVQ